MTVPDDGPTPACGLPFAEPSKQIGKYEILDLLGRGGMGAVYKAFDPFLERQVAIKMMLPQVAEVPEQKQRFEREARAIARLAHANVVTVYDLGYHTDGAPYIVMELLEGRDLEQLLQEEPELALSKKISIVVQVLHGLGHAHKVGIVHRDIKPANVSITEDGTAKIMDFGIARLNTAAMTGDGAVFGTAAYMSPEQARGEQIDGRSDLFSVGSLLCELVTGKRPFIGDSALATMFKIAQSPPSIQLPDGPERELLLPVLERALAKDREDRFSTGEEFAEALTRCLDAVGDSSSPSTISRDTRPAPRAGTTANGEDLGDAEAAAIVRGRPAPSARPADTGRLFALLREIYVGGKSGRLHLWAGKSCRSLHIVKGQITHGISDLDGERLGDVLVRYGVITEHDREQAADELRSQEVRLGQVLVGRGLLDEEQLQDALGLHVREVLFAMLECSEGTHIFEELEEAAPEPGTACRLSTGEVILEATRRVQDPELVRKVLGDTDRLLRLSRNPVLRSQKITLTPTDGYVMSRVDGTLSAREVVSLSPIETEETERSLFGLLCTGIIDYEEKDETRRPRSTPTVAVDSGATGTSTVPPPPSSTDAATTMPPPPAASSATASSAPGQEPTPVSSGSSTKDPTPSPSEPSSKAPPAAEVPGANLRPEPSRVAPPETDPLADGEPRPGDARKAAKPVEAGPADGIKTDPPPETKTGEVPRTDPPAPPSQEEREPAPEPAPDEPPREETAPVPEPAPDEPPKEETASAPEPAPDGPPKEENASAPEPASSTPPKNATPPAPGAKARAKPSARAKGSRDSERRAPPDTVSLRGLILEAHAGLKGDHFQVLGLSRSATQKEVRQAFAFFARLLHPDACRQPALADVRDKRDEVFMRINEAYETLRDTEKRRKYEAANDPYTLQAPKTPGAAGAAPGNGASSRDSKEAAAADAARLLGEAEGLFAKAEYPAVIQKVEAILPDVKGPLRTRATLLLARTFIKRPGWRKRAETVLLDLIRDDPTCTPAQLFLGQLYADQGMASRARRMYRQVLEQEPGNRAALAEMEKLDHPEEPAGSKRRRWFKRR